MNRLSALQLLNSFFEEDPLIITCGATAREMASIHQPKNHLPLLDSMGLTTPIGIGVALGTSRRVGVIDGDGSFLMGFSALPTLLAYGSSNLTVVVLDNEQHASADQMDSQSKLVDIAGASEGLGLKTIRCSDQEGLLKSLREKNETKHPKMIFAKIEKGNSPGIPFYLADPAYLGKVFSEIF